MAINLMTDQLLHRLQNPLFTMPNLKYASIEDSVSKKFANIDILFGLKREFVKNDKYRRVYI